MKYEDFATIERAIIDQRDNIIGMLYRLDSKLDKGIYEDRQEYYNFLCEIMMKFIAMQDKVYGAKKK